MANELKLKIDKWLRQIGSTPVDQADPLADWHFLVDYPAKSPNQLNVLAPATHPDRVLIIAAAEVSHEHREAFDKLDDEGKESFLWRFRHTINNCHTDYQVEGVKGPLDCPSRFQISVTRYEDGLTLDSFAHSLGCVLKTELAAIWVVQEHLAPRGFGPGSRFDFKRFGT